MRNKFEQNLAVCNLCICLQLARLEEQAGAGAIALQQLPELKDQVKSLTAENESLASNYNSERVLRKKYYNMVEDMKGGPCLVYDLIPSQLWLAVNSD